MRDARVLLPHPFEPRIVVQPSWKDRDKSSKREKDEDGYTFGHSSEYLPVLVKGEYPRSIFVKVKISELKDHQLYGVKV